MPDPTNRLRIRDLGCNRGGLKRIFPGSWLSPSTDIQPTDRGNPLIWLKYICRCLATEMSGSACMQPKAKQLHHTSGLNLETAVDRSNLNLTS